MDFSFFKVVVSTFSILLSYKTTKSRLRHGEIIKVKQIIYSSLSLQMKNNVIQITIALINKLVEYLNF